jgi:hypothetical protein
MGGIGIDNDLFIASDYEGSAEQDRKDDGNFQFNCFLHGVDIADQKGLASERVS